MTQMLKKALFGKEHTAKQQHPSWLQHLINGWPKNRLRAFRAPLLMCDNQRDVERLFTAITVLLFYFQ